MQIVKSEDIKGTIFEWVNLKDPHLNFGFANRIRVNHNSDLKNKIKFVENYCITNKVQNIFFTGDVTDTNEEDKWTFKQYRLNKSVLNNLKDSGINLYSPAGNHDMFNGFNGTDETVFGELVKENVINYLTKEPIIMTFDPGIGASPNVPNPNGLSMPGLPVIAQEEQKPKTIGIFGIDYSKHVDLVKEQLNNIHLSNGIDLKIVVFHAHCTPSIVAVTDFTYEQLIKDYFNIDIFICGHYHGGFPSWVFAKKDAQGNDTKQHTTIINNWSFQRVVRDYYNEMEIHIPEMEHIRIGWSHANNDFIVSLDTVKIPCKKYEEAFKPKAIELLKVTKKEQFEFFNTVNFDEIPTGNDDTETLKMISTKDGISEIVVNRALTYLNNIVVTDIE